MKIFNRNRVWHVRPQVSRGIIPNSAGTSTYYGKNMEKHNTTDLWFSNLQILCRDNPYLGIFLATASSDFDGFYVDPSVCNAYFTMFLSLDLHETYTRHRADAIFVARTISVQKLIYHCHKDH